MHRDETARAESQGATNSADEGVSRRQFIERLQRTAIFAAPLVATVTLMTPKAKGY